MATFSHLGHCVADLERSRRFYVELLGFTEVADIRPPDESSAKLMRLTTPLGLNAVYLRRDGLLLELLHYEHHGTRPVRPRTLDEPGLTHISVWVEDGDAYSALLEQVPAYGGEVLTDTDLGLACMIRDPDGQLIEVLGRPFDPSAFGG